MDHQDHMNSGQVGDSPGNNIASGVANMTINDGHQRDMKNGTAAHMGAGDSLVKGLYKEGKNTVVIVLNRRKKMKV